MDPAGTPVGQATVEFDLFSDGGETGALMRGFDWSASPLGLPDRWPKSLRTCVRIILTSRQPMFVWWGPQLINLYNDAYRTIVGGKHPHALGQPASAVWREIWDEVGPRADMAMRSNRGTYDEALLLIMQRNGYEEETYYTFSYSPVPSDDGSIGGIICANTDETQRIVDERRLVMLRNLEAGMARARTWQETCSLAAESLAGESRDIPFALIYVTDGERHEAQLAGSCGFPAGHPHVPLVVRLGEGDAPWRLAEAFVAGDLCQIDLAPYRELPVGAWPKPPVHAVAIPLAAAGNTGRPGILVVGLNPYRVFDARYQGFVRLIAGQIAAGIAHAQAYENERRRAEALAELDRAKTVFFSNVSHELRTPLTLMLAPLEDSLADRTDPLPPQQRERQEMVHRNAQRLLKLVNSLLDFSRIEAGRMRAAFEPVDLAQSTIDLVSTFRSVIERGGMELRVDCPPLSRAVHVDRGMWENIVLNLMSNAFKHTFTGAITATLRERGDTVEFSVADSGVGIAPAQLARVFERFYRVEGARSRTHEGSGIGLALVLELARLHGGTVRAESEPQRGSVFTVALPLGSAHLPQEQVVAKADSGGQPSARAGAFVAEAGRWTPEAEAGSNGTLPLADPAPAAGGSTGRVLLVEDNADMRAYVRRLLQDHWQVDTAVDGVEALAAVRAAQPDLILSDIMMPRLDGLGLLRELRREAATRHIPVILLSARAGEEAGIEGLGAGADDYLTKPFSALELVARVRAHLQLKRQRDQAMREIRHSNETLQLALDSARMMAWSYDPTADALTASPNSGEILGLPPGRTLSEGRYARELIHPEDAARHADEVQTAIRERRRYRSAFRVRRPVDGRVAWLEEHGVTHERDGRVQLSGVTVDVTQRMAAEEAIRASEARFRGIVDQSLAGIAELDAEGRFTTVNDRYCMITGYARSELLGMSNLAVTHPEEHARSSELVAGLVAGQRFFELEKRYLRRDGTPVWVHNSVSGIHDQAGRLARMVVVTVDITQRKLIEQALRHQTEGYATLLNRAPLGIYVIDADFRLRDVNPIARPVFSSVPGGGIGRDFEGVLRQLWPKDFAGEIMRIFRHTLATGESYDAAEQIEQRIDSGITEAYEWRVERIPQPDGRFGLVCYFRDILRHVQARITLAQHADELRNANTELEHFASVASHDLQEPLRMISNYSGLLQRKYGEQFDDRGRRYFEYIVSGAVRMRSLIHALREYSQLGKKGVVASECDLGTIVQETLDVLQPEIEAKSASIDAGPLPVIVADPVRIGQLLQNLIANALKFVAAGQRPHIRIGAQDAGTEWRVTVADNGIGIPEHARPKVFQIFQRLHRADEYAGSGIGLATCKKIVEQHGGRIGVESTPGAGSVFWFTLAKHVPATARPDGAAPVGGP